MSMKSEPLTRLHLVDEQATIRLGEEIGREVFAGLLIRLIGPLGTGKTTLVKGVAKGMGAAEAEVSSPSYTVVNSYTAKRYTLLHADLYRLGQAPFIDDTGIYEALERRDAVVAIEWAERVELSIYPSLTVTLDYSGGDASDGRDAVVTASGKGARVLERLNARLAGAGRTAS